MANYTGSKCICCGKRFTDEDDIVVCPDCGTPYHRSCYVENGKCINSELHDKNIGWMPDAPAEEVTVTQASEVKRCIRCGAENDPSLRYCEQCGTPLVNMGAPRPFNDEADGTQKSDTDPINTTIPGINITPVRLNQDSDIGGVKLGDLARYVGPNPLGFLPSFIKFGKTDRKLSVNFFAFLWPELYFMYRKMRKVGIIVAVLMAALNLPAMIEYLCSGEYGIKINFGINVKSENFRMLQQAAYYIRVTLGILAGLFANYIYYRQAKKDITKIYHESEDEDRTVINYRIMNKGGISYADMLLGLMIYMMCLTGALVLLGKIL